MRCPSCGLDYGDWFRASINLAIEDFDADYICEATTATCPTCGTTVDLGSIIVSADGVWSVAR